MKIQKRKRKDVIEKAQNSIERKSMIINVMVFSILSFIAVLLITVIA
ncbi:hypothetical protein K6T82_05665 [Flavobacterium sp. 17A]|uniref:Uncharacterized protein n=1 Tax=Flavobacterium potami TaxID=2872310 RepID=A0A9X1H7Q1_9FLAO|nr:hypothetical protein [Flavobacterium potami]MBZ4034244.1 hypothetical protein [Flavobacterium potami]